MSSVLEPGTKKKTSKYHTQPGSVHSKVLNYDNKSNVFQNVDVHPSVKETRKQVIAMKDSKKLLKKPEFTTSTFTQPVSQQNRNLMRTLSSFQSEKLPHDFRATEVPQVYKNVHYVPTKSKYQIDQGAFIDENVKPNIIERNIDPHKQLLLEKEERLNQMLNGKPNWNASTEFNYAHPHVVKRKNVKLDGYVSPHERHKQSANAIREAKLEARRLEEERLMNSGKVEVFTLGITEKRRAEALNKFIDGETDEGILDEEYDE